MDYALMKALVAYLSQMKAQNEGAAKLLSIASAFTHVAGTFLKNYLKMTRQQQQQQQQHHQRQHKRRREEPPANSTDDEEEEVWVPRPKTSFTPTRGTPPKIPSSPTPAAHFSPLPVASAASAPASLHYPAASPAQFVSPASAPQHQQQQQQQQQQHRRHHHHQQQQQQQFMLSPQSTATDSDMEGGPGSVDLQQTSFLRWPQQSSAPPPPPPLQEEPMAMAPMEQDPSSTSALFDIDLEALMAEPGGFQMQMAQEATMRGPLEFDWFGWDGQFGM